MAGASGLFGSVVLTTGGTTRVEGIGEWSLDVAMTTQEVSEFGDQWKVRLQGQREATFSFGPNGIAGTATQKTLRDYMLAGSAVGLRLYETETNYWTIGTAWLTGMNRAINVAGKLETGFDGEASGSITYT